MKWLSRFLFTGLIVTLFSGCSSFNYQIQVMNYGTHGVIVHDKYLGQGYQPLKLNTIAPKGGRMTLPYFKGHPDDLPKGKHTIYWQLAKLTDCAFEREITSTDPKYPGTYTSRSQCTFNLIEGKVHQKVIDFDDIRGSWAYTKTGMPTSNLGRNTLLLTFIFRDDKLDLDVSNGMTNPWK